MKVFLQNGYYTGELLSQVHKTFNKLAMPSLISTLSKELG